MGKIISMIAALAIMMVVASVDGRKGATSPAQLHEDQHLTEIGAANSPTLLENAHPCPRGRYRPSGLKDMECELCPRGTFGNTEGLTTKQVGRRGEIGEKAVQYIRLFAIHSF